MPAILAGHLAATPGAWAADPSKGRDLYQTYCRACHGDDGRGIVANAPDFSHGQGLMAPDAVLAQSLMSGKGAMPAFQGILKGNQILDVVAFVRTLQR